MSGLSKTPSGPMWHRIGGRKRSGVLVPLFSVYSRDSAGVGDLDDLRLVADLCVKTGDTIIQLLPMNEVGPAFCPYDAISSFAIEPLYISLEDIGVSNASILKKMAALKKEFPAGRSHVDYRVKDAKLMLLREIFEADGAGCRSADFNNFVNDNSYWLDDLGLFKVLKSEHNGKPWYEWEEGYQLRDEDALYVIRRDHEDELLFHAWVQWQLYKQFKNAKEYANSKGVFLKGDLPILISRDSADVWANPGFFKLDVAAGAPPDMYCAKGQRWGMPTYEWEAIAADGYRYHKEKLKYAENFYDILRVDHVVGLFRIWSIPFNDPVENVGLNGFFDPRDESLWEAHGRNILSMMLDNTKMLLCAEDLGIIPKSCTDTLKDYGIPGNEVQRWVKDWSVRHDFLGPDGYRVLSVSMLSTHDTTNWAAWWENEAGTVDEALFIRKCADRRIDYDMVKDQLFDPKLSRRGRLRWKAGVSSKEIYIGILGKRPEELMDFIDLYENSFKEKEKLWKRLGFKAPMRERSDPEIVGAALDITMSSASVFCIELIFDRIFLTGMLKGDPYQYRVNTPGTVSRDNWSLTIPVCLEDLIKDKLWAGIKEKADAVGRG